MAIFDLGAYKDHINPEGLEKSIKNKDISGHELSDLEREFKRQIRFARQTYASSSKEDRKNGIKFYVTLTVRDHERALEHYQKSSKIFCLDTSGILPKRAPMPLTYTHRLTFSLTKQK